MCVVCRRTTRRRGAAHQRVSLLPRAARARPPTRVLLNSDCHVKLCDFGLCRSVAETAGPSPVLTDYVATRWYRAPEASIYRADGLGFFSSSIFSLVPVSMTAGGWRNQTELRPPPSRQILLGSPQYTKAVDMWAVGCILGEMLTAKPVFPGTSTMNQLEKVRRRNV